MNTYSVKVTSTFGRTETFTVKAGSAEAARRWVVGQAEEKWHVTFNQLTSEVNMIETATTRFDGVSVRVC